MRRILLIVLVLALLLGNTAFAQDITIGRGTLSLAGKIVSGLFLDIDDVPLVSDAQSSINTDSFIGGAQYFGRSGRVRMWNESDSKNPARVDLSASYALADAGFKARLRADNALQGLGAEVSARYAYGWIDLLDHSVKLTGGYIDLVENVWGTKGDGDWDIGGNGIRLEIKPIEGLNFGAFLVVPNANSTPPGQPSMEVISGIVTPERVLREMAFGFRYARPAFYVSSQLKLDSDIDGLIINSVDTLGNAMLDPWSGAEDETRLMFGAGFTMVPGLVISAEGNFEGLGNFAARGRADLRQTVSYDCGDLTLGLKAKELLYGYDLGLLVSNYNTLGPWMQFKPFAVYRLSDAFSAGLEAGYGFGYLVDLTPDSTNQGNAVTIKYAREKYDIFVKPNVSLNLGNGLSLKAWYMLTAIAYQDLWDGAAYDDRRHSAIPKTKDNLSLVDSILKHQFALEFTFSF